MTGYPESLTDPSYCGQLIVLTYPSIGNYGVPHQLVENQMLRFFESDKIHARALIISDYSEIYNHWNAEKSLGDWLKEEKVPGLFGIDTRHLTKIIREKGTMLAKIVFDNDIHFDKPDDRNLVSEVSTRQRVVYGEGKHRILLVDCGVKSNIIRCLLDYDTTVIKVPWDHDFHQEDFDGLFISNGPAIRYVVKLPSTTSSNRFQKIIPFSAFALATSCWHWLPGLALTSSSLATAATTSLFCSMAPTRPFSPHKTTVTPLPPRPSHKAGSPVSPT